MPTAYVLIQREERKSEGQLLWTTELSDHADFFIILQRMSVSMDRVKKTGSNFFSNSEIGKKTWSGEPHPRGLLGGA